MTDSQTLCAVKSTPGTGNL